MNLYRLSWKNLLNKPLNTLLSVVLFALGISIITVVLLLSRQMESQMDRNQAGIGMVVGAKGSPLQLILCSIFHVDFPTGNIKLQEAQFLKKHPLVKQTIPQALGDSYKGYRIVGTTLEYPQLYEAELAEGEWWEKDLEVTLGSLVAAQLGLQVGDSFEGQHGMAESGDAHDHHPFRVTGIMQPTGTVLDQLMLTNVASVWKVHEHAEEKSEVPSEGAENKAHAEGETDHDHNEEHDHATAAEQADREITTMLVKFRNPMGAISLPRLINENTNMQAASPAFEISRLYSLMGVGVDALRYLAFIILAVSGLSVFISLYNSLKDRKYELAFLRVLGARPWQLFRLVLLEGLILTILGGLLGMGLGHLGMGLLAELLAGTYHYQFSAWSWVAEEGYLLMGALAIGFLASILPAVQAFRTEVSSTLAEA